ncbi:g8957 [Coccomyxa viridis]|uniref:G8957 protein n=1 Tax=Coccomyxa viridis TaxID=1274662 RepID=A0ABP1G8F1_9CHLO
MTAIHQQIALVTTRTGNIIGAWDVETGTHVASFKDNASGPNALSLLGQDYLMAAQAAKGALHFWTWHKDAVLQRCYAVEPIVAVACSPDAVYCAGGGQSGTIYLWEVPSGRLLRSWPAHYKAVTVLQFSGDGSILLSGGEDTVALAWFLMDLLDASAPRNASQAPQPLHTWSQHTLPITSIHCGRTMDPVVVTTSLDQRCNVYSMAKGSLLRTIAFPAALHSAVMDPGEHSLHVGSADGRIFRVSLVGGVAVESALLNSPAAADISMQAHDREWTPLHGHTQAVTALAYTVDGMFMLSGSEDGTARVWEVRSSQCMRVISAPDRAPVTGLIVLDRPPHLASGQGRQGRLSSSDSGSLSTVSKRPQPLASFCKFMGMQGAMQPWEGPAVLLDGSSTYRGQVSQTGLLSGMALTNLAGASSQPVSLLKPRRDAALFW